MNAVDDPGLLKTLTHIFESNRFSVNGVTNGKDALFLHIGNATVTSDHIFFTKMLKKYVDNIINRCYITRRTKGKGKYNNSDPEVLWKNTVSGADIC